MNQLPKREKTRYKKGKVLPSDNNSPNKTDYSRETEPGEIKKERFCLQITTAQIRQTTQVRQNQVKKKERFFLQITTAQIGLTTQERRNKKKKKGKILPLDNNSLDSTQYTRETEPGEKKGKGSAFR